MNYFSGWNMKMKRGCGEVSIYIAMLVAKLSQGVFPILNFDQG